MEQLKGGQLARLASPATLLSLVLSDVVGSPLDVIASGPTVADRSTWDDAWAIVQRYDLASVLPAAVVQRLQAGREGLLPDTPKPGDPAGQHSQTLVVADNALAARAAQAAAREQGFDALLLTTFIEGEAREVAKVAVALGREVVAHGRPVAPPACLLLGGETTVVVRGAGQGGRNQELALAAALLLASVREGPRDRRRRAGHRRQRRPHRRGRRAGRCRQRGPRPRLGTRCCRAPGQQRRLPFPAAPPATCCALAPPRPTSTT